MPETPEISGGKTGAGEQTELLREIRDELVQVRELIERAEATGREFLPHLRGLLKTRTARLAGRWGNQG